MGKQVVIVGAGLVGSLLAVSLLQKGFQVEVYERYTDIRSIPSLGKSINLVLTSRGLRAIAKVSRSIADEMLKLSVRVTHRGLHVGGEDFAQRYGKDDTEFNNSISRFELNVFLINAAQKAGAKFHFNSRLVGCDFQKDTVRFEVGDKAVLPQMIGGGMGQDNKAASEGLKTIDVKYDHMFGADGGGSAVRYAMRDAGLTDFYEDFINSGYKEMIFPKVPAKGAKPMNPNHLHIWPRHEHFLMTLADRPGTFTGTFYLPVTGPESFATITTKEQAAAFFTKYYSDVIPYMGENGLDKMVQQYMDNSVGRLGTVRCHKYNYKGKVCLIGDSAHAMVPFFGQGTNCGFEDVLELGRMMEANKDKIDENVFNQFDYERRVNGTAMQNMALENFYEMQSRVADPEFLLIKGIENIIENNCPELYRSRYAMVCYGGMGNVTYANAFRLGVVQEEIRKSLAKGLKKPEDLNIEKAKEVLRKKLLPLQKQLKIDLTTVNHEYWVHEKGKPKAKL